MTPDLGRYWIEEVIPFEAPNLPRPRIANNGEEAHAVDPLPRGLDDQGWDDPGACRQKPGSRPSYDQTLAEPRSPRREDESSSGSNAEVSHEPSGQDRRGEVGLQEAALTRTLAKKLTAKNHPVSNILLLFERERNNRSSILGHPVLHSTLLRHKLIGMWCIYKVQFA